MAKGREHFALDWIKSELLETLNNSRQALEAYVESDRDETRMRVCLTGLHQVHGTLVMLELQGVSLLADHLERVAQELLNGAIEAESSAAQSLMQGILELPGHIDEIQRGLPDSVQPVTRLVNELRQHIGEAPLAPTGDYADITGAASEVAIKRFAGIDGVDKAKKIRGAYQQVLLSILKGEDVAGSVVMLSKVAQGLQRVCADTPHEAQWEAFGEFVSSLGNHEGPLDSAAVKLLRRVDSAMRELAQSGVEALRSEISLDLVRQLTDAAQQRGQQSPKLELLQEALSLSGSADGLAISGRQALGSAAAALREELVLVKDQLDLIVRAGSDAAGDLVMLVAPLKQIGSTLSLLGFESSRTIVADQIEVLNRISSGPGLDASTLLSIASALVQVDENLASFTHGGKGEAEKITDDAQRAVVSEARTGLDQVKQDIVDFISSEWDSRHIHNTTSEFTSICGALDMIPLARASRLLAECANYIDDTLVGGPQPTWEDMDHFADAISGVDYYLERLAEDSSNGAEDILDLVDRSLSKLGLHDHRTLDLAAESPLDTDQPVTSISRDSVDRETVEASEDQPETVAISSTDDGTEDAAEDATEDAGDETAGDGGADRTAVAQGTTLAEETECPEESAQDVAESPQAVAEEPADVAEELADGAEQATEVGTEESVEDVAGATDEVAVEEIADAAPGIEAIQSTPTTPNQPTMLDTFESDEEIVEIFVEEVGEVLETVDETLPRWRESLADEETLTIVRRAFHTLKGSSRIVGANVIGEMAWSIENMLNRLIDGTVEPTEQFVTVVIEALELTSYLRDAFETQTAPEMDAVARLMERADVLASGGVLDDAHEAVHETAIESVDLEGEPLEIFVTEALGHLDALHHAVSDRGVELTEASMRALHTLTGSAAMAGITAFAALAQAAYELAQALRTDDDRLLEGDNADFFRGLIAALSEAVAELKSGGTPQDHPQLIADVDQLLAAATAVGAPSAQQVLMGLSGLTVLMDAPEFLTAWQQGAMDLEFSDQLLVALKEIQQAAQANSRPKIAELSAALNTAHDHLAHEMLSGASFAVLQSGHEQLISMFDALMADQSLAAADEVIGQINELLIEPSPVEETVDEQRQVQAGHQMAEQGRGDEELTAAEADNVVVLRADFQTDDGDVIDQVGSEYEEETGASAENEIGLEDISAELISELDDGVTPGQPLPPPLAETVQNHQETAEIKVDPALAELLPEDFDDEIIEIFFEEADEILENLDENIHAWSSEPENLLYLEHILRGLHTLKGGARLSGLVRLGDASHQFESFLVDAQNQEGNVDASFFGYVNARYDELANILSVVQKLVAGEPVEGAAAALAGEPLTEPASSDDAMANVDSAIQVSETPADAHKAAHKEAHEAEPPADRDEAAADIAPVEVTTKQDAETGKEPRSSQEMVRVGSALLENLVNLAGESSIVRARVEQGMSDFTGALDEMETTIERVREQLRRLDMETEAQILFRQDRPDGPSYDQFDPLEMDRYSQLQQLSRGLSESASDMLELKERLLLKARESESLLLQQARINTELQEGLMRTRMVPFSRLLPRLRRIVRQTAGELGKDVEFHAYNAEGELDRNLLERMIPPLEHMLRNAVDHGIESKELRKNYGKPVTGRIDLRLSREGGDVVIEIGDDGTGIDVEAVRAKAVERGLMADDAKLRDDEICQFVLAPGFSTAKVVTQISGRGVGLDVVHSEVKKLGGSIQIASREGHGSRFIIRVPFTVSVNRDRSQSYLSSP